MAPSEERGQRGKVKGRVERGGKVPMDWPERTADENWLHDKRVHGSGNDIHDRSKGKNNPTGGAGLRCEGRVAST